ncbi:MAG TPA: SDR family NAD(P)-dependent oxidoreductase [Nocardioidaceae bacterium]|nr:SDR family NAD(P)-dependent oxidoreductase [Nocardioidaceae bacterium]
MSRVHETETRVALVTGGASGLGREVARQLVEVGITTVISSRRAADAAATAKELDALALDVGLDLTDGDSVNAFARQLENELGRLDVLVNNAAAYVDWTETVSGASLDEARRVMETNLFGAWQLTQALLPLLLAGPAPRIVNVSSGAGSHDEAQFGLAARGGKAASYGISKAALNALTSTLAAQLRDTPLLVNAVCPGLTATYPGAEAMGARPVGDSARGVVWAATLPHGGPTGGFFRDAQPLPW